MDKQKPPKSPRNVRMINCEACRPSHEIPADQIVEHQREVRQLSARKSASKASRRHGYFAR